MDQWGWELMRWLAYRVQIPVGPLSCVIDGRTRGRPLTTTSVRQQLRRTAAKAGVRRFAPHQLRHAHAVEMAREGVPLNVIRQRRDHRHRARAQSSDDSRQRRPTPASVGGRTGPADPRGPDPLRVALLVAQAATPLARGSESQPAQPTFSQRAPGPVPPTLTSRSGGRHLGRLGGTRPGRPEGAEVILRPQDPWSEIPRLASEQLHTFAGGCADQSDAPGSAARARRRSRSE